MSDYGNVIPLAFFDRPAARVARELIGKRLVCDLGHDRLAFLITETEAYVGEHDLACHSAKGRTRRTEIMYGPAGRFYIYRVYGLHWMLNVVTGDIGDAAGVLIRSVEGIKGPGGVTSALGINASLAGKTAEPSSGLWFDESGFNDYRVYRTPRIGVTYAGPIWSAKKLRFVLQRSRIER